MTTLVSALPMQSVGSLPATDRLNSVLGLELAAHACYSLTADRWRDNGRGTWVGLLRQLAEEHELAAESVRQQISDLGDQPADESGSLGLWAPVARAIRQDESELLRQALRSERQMLDEYQESMSSLDSGSTQLLRNLLLPTQERHVQLLTSLMSG